MSSDSHSRRIAILRAVGEFDAQLKSLVAEKKSCIDKSCLPIRESLQRAYEQAVLNDCNPEGQDGESQMWKTCFYKPIEEWRRKIRSFTTLINEAQSRNDQKRAQASQQEQAKTSTIFHGFLESSTGFYHNLLAKLRTKHALNLDRSVISSGGSAGSEPEGLVGGRNFVDPKSATYRHNLTMFRILLRLGDLARYQRDLVGIPDVDWQAAWAYYMDAQRLMPDQGMPYNQLAVLCTYSHDTVAALYYYARSLALDTPSETGRSNIDVLMRDTSFSKYLEARRKYLEISKAPKKARQIGDGIGMTEKQNAAGNASPALADLWPVFVSGFFGLHNSDSITSLELVQTNLDAFLSDFEQLVASDYLMKRATCVPRPNGAGSSTCMQLIVYNIFAAWSISMQFNETEVLSNEPAKLKLIRRLNLVVQVSLAMLTFLIEKINATSADWRTPSTVSSHTKHSMDGDSRNNNVAAKASRLEILPVVSVFLHWLSTASTRLVSFDLSSARESAIFARFQKAIIGLLPAVLPAATQYHAALSTTQGKRRGAPPLPEDTELFPFVPLAAAHNDVSFMALSTIHDSEASFSRRCYKIGLFALRAAQDVHLVSSTRTPLEDPLHHFASSASTHISPSPHTGTPLFTTAQAAELQACFYNPNTTSGSSHAPSSGASDAVQGSLQSQEVPITSSGFNHAVGVAHPHGAGTTTTPTTTATNVAAAVSSAARVASPAHLSGTSNSQQHSPHSSPPQAGQAGGAYEMSGFHANYPSSVTAFEQLADALSSPGSLDRESLSSSFPAPMMSSSAATSPPPPPQARGHTTMMAPPSPIGHRPTSRGSTHLSESLDDYEGLMAESHKLVSAPNDHHRATNTGGGAPRMLFSDRFDSEPSLTTGVFTSTTGAIGSPIDPRTGTSTFSSNAMEGVIAFDGVSSESQASAAASSSYDPWGGSRGHTDSSNVATAGSSRGLTPSTSTETGGIQQSFGSPMVMSNGAPFWNPFVGTPSGLIAPDVPSSTDALASAMQGRSRASQDQARPLLFPSSRP